MKIPKSTLGLLLVSIYIVVSIYLIRTQGFVGESFIVVFLGLPWSLFLILLDRFSPREDTVLFYIYFYIGFLGPIILNIVVYYWFGVGVEKLRADHSLKSRFWWMVVLAIIILYLSVWIWFGPSFF